MKVIFFIFFLIILESTQVVAASSPDHGPIRIELTKELRIAIENGVRRDLKDPDSAKFSEINVYKGESGLFSCGSVNARNSYGGYTGYTPFFIYIIIGKSLLNEKQKYFAHGTIMPDETEDGYRWFYKNFPECE